MLLDGALLLTDLDFTDDLALQTISIQDAQSLLHNFEVDAEKVGLFMNTSKTESRLSTSLIISNNKDHLEHAHDFEYLGSYIVDSRATEQP